MFFVLSEADCRKACLALASQTGWPLSELQEMDCEELLAWLEAWKALNK